MNIRESAGKIDWSVMGKAIGLMLLSWGALPIIYFMLLRRKKEKWQKKTEVSEKTQH